MYDFRDILEYEFQNCMFHINMFSDNLGVFSNRIPLTYLDMELNRFKLLIDFFT